jgi:transcription elongation GreA/GreB family factor
MSLKQNLYRQCHALVNQRYQSIQRQIADLQNSLLSETKSSAGDKHETGRAMVQLEREKAGHQLAEINKLRTVLSQLQIDKTSSHVILGSVVFTSKANYFISVSLGALEVDGQTFYAISPKTPIGQLLMGKIVKDEVSFNGNAFVIEEVV